jgi:hypothetical protein
MSLLAALPADAPHIPVLIDEVIAALALIPAGGDRRCDTGRGRLYARAAGGGRHRPCL